MKRISGILAAVLLAFASLAGAQNVNLTGENLSINSLGLGGVIANGSPGITGSTTNDTAAIGNVGEIETATVIAGSAVSLTTATAKTITSVALTPGDWDIEGQCDNTLAAATTTVFTCGLSLTTNTQGTQPGGSGLGTDGLTSTYEVLTTISTTIDQSTLSTRLSVAANTTVYLVAQNTFSAGTEAAYGTIRARRVR